MSPSSMIHLVLRCYSSHYDDGSRGNSDDQARVASVLILYDRDTEETEGELCNLCDATVDSILHNLRT